MLLAVVGFFGFRALGTLVRSNVDVITARGHHHEQIAALADTGSRPPGAFFALRAARLARSDDFGAGISESCGCKPHARPGRTTCTRGGCS